MNQESEETVNDEMRTEYDFSGGIRGKYYQAYRQAITSYQPDYRLGIIEIIEYGYITGGNLSEHF